MFQKRKNSLKKKLLMAVVGFAVSLTAGICVQKQTVVSADTNAYVNATGSNLTYTQLADGGINVTMQSSDDTNISPDKLIYNKTYAVTDAITAYVKPDDMYNAAAQYLVLGVMNAGTQTSLYEVHIAATPNDGKFNIRTSGNVWNAFDRASDGIATIQFAISTDNMLTFYYNGTLMETWGGVTAQSFPNGIQLSFRAHAVTWWGGTVDQLPAYIRMGDPQAIDSEKIYYRGSNEDVTYALDMNGATATAVQLNGTALNADDYTLTQSVLTVKASAIETYVDVSGKYDITVKNPAKDINLSLRVSDTANMQVVETQQTYDLYTDDTLSLTVWKNQDSFVRVVDANGEDVTATYDNTLEKLTISATYMQSLNVGNYVFRVISTGNSEGTAFTVTVGSTAPPTAVGGNLTFDVYQPADVTFSINAYQNANVWLEGNAITDEDYTLLGNEITIKSSYFSRLTPDTYTLSLCGENGATEVVIVVKDTQPMQLVSSSNVVVNLNSLTDATFVLDMKYDEVLTVDGNSITESDWNFDVDDSAVVLGRTFLATLDVDTYSFTITSKNGANIAVTIEIVSQIAPALEGTATVTFTKSNPQNVAFSVQTNDGDFVFVTGGDITADDYVVSTQNGVCTLTIKVSYLSKLADGNYAYALLFTNGEVTVNVTVENALTATFESGYTTLYNMVGAGDMLIDINANYGVLLSVSIANGQTLITLNDTCYNFDVSSQTFTLYKAYLDTLQSNTTYILAFDNGELTLVVETAFERNIFDVYEPLYVDTANQSVRVSAEEDYWTKVEYLTPVYGAYGGGVKFVTPFSAEHVIELYVDFKYVPDILGTSFALTLSNESYKMHYGNWPSELFATFSVGEKFLQSAYFGIPNIHTEMDQQISHELLKRSTNGYETFTFDIGENGTKMYFNGLLIRELPSVTRSNFTNNNVYVMFTPLFWQEQEGTSFAIKSNANANVFDSFYIVNTQVMAPVVVNAQIRGEFGGVSLVADGVELPINGYTYSRDNATGNTRIEIAAEALLYRNGFDWGTEYKLCIKTSAGNAYVPLVISDAKHLEFLQTENVFDKKQNNNLSIYYAINKDTIDRVEGNGITANDYEVQNGAIVLKASFLSTFAIGQIEFVVYSAEKSQGQTFSVYIVDSTASTLGTANASFDLNGAADIWYTLTLTQGHTLTVTGNGITAADYRLEDGKLIISKTYLATLGVGEYKFTIFDYYTSTLYNSVEISLTVTNSVAPTFSDGSKECTIHYVLGSGQDVTIMLATNKGVFLDAVGGYITADLYRYDTQNNTITFYKEWFDMMEQDDFKVRIRLDNGNVMVRFIVEDANTQPSKGCSSALDITITAGLTALCAASVALKKKKYDKGE